MLKSVYFLRKKKPIKIMNLYIKNLLLNQPHELFQRLKGMVWGIKRWAGKIINHEFFSIRPRAYIFVTTVLKTDTETIRITLVSTFNICIVLFICYSQYVSPTNIVGYSGYS